MKMPPMPLEHTDYYGFSEFWYSSEDVADIGGPYDFNLFSTVSKGFCGDHWDNILKNFNDGKYKTQDMDRLKHQCMKSSWIAVALHEGLKFPKDFHNLNSVANTLPNGQVVHWTIGAILYRTRFYPLRKIQEAENQNSSEANIPPPSAWDYQLWHYMALFL